MHACPFICMQWKAVMHALLGLVLEGNLLLLFGLTGLLPSTRVFMAPIKLGFWKFHGPLLPSPLWPCWPNFGSIGLGYIQCKHNTGHECLARACAFTQWGQVGMIFLFLLFKLSITRPGKSATKSCKKYFFGQVELGAF